VDGQKHATRCSIFESGEVQGRGGVLAAEEKGILGEYLLRLF
jgi:hypothetical protein